jgi:hypothetical protein
MDLAMRKISALVLVVLLLCVSALVQAQDRSDVDAALQAAIADIGARTGLPVRPGSYSWITAVPLNGPQIATNCPAAAALAQNAAYRTVISVSVDYKADRYLYYFAPDATQLTFCGATHFVTPTLTFTPVTYTPTASVTPTPSTTPRPNAVICPGFMPSRLMAGEQGRVSKGNTVSLRSEPRTDADLIRSVYDTQTFSVLTGPICDADGHAWWQVLVGSSTGWIVEGEGVDFYVEPIIPTTAQPTAIGTPVVVPARPTSTPMPTATRIAMCPGGSLMTRLIVGRPGRVTPGEANNLRETGASNAKLIGQIPGGATFDVLAGPDCDGFGRAWWQVRYNGQVGWTIEGDKNQYFVEPLP